MEMLLILLIVIGMSLRSFNCSELRRVDDSDLIHLLNVEHNVVVLFSMYKNTFTYILMYICKNNCEGCLEYETTVSLIQNDLKEALGAMVVQAHESNLVGIYDPTKEPALVYYRHGIPILYHGNIIEDQIVEFFNDNKEPAVKELSDENFEHLTQASSGATTGDWFIFFYSADCVLCQRLYAIWESVGGKLRQKFNIARMNRLETGISTAKRLGILGSPEFIFIRQGKMYRYIAKTYRPEDFVQFAELGYLESPSQMVPEPPSVISLFFDRLQNFVNADNVFLLVAFGLSTFVILIYLAKHISKRISRETIETNDKIK
ncbi:uncharacterized protein LOC108154079 isoform X2 [Drosophila miranda]|uniref:uncharacterized protein LOC108154079 isoform X2 n=1 Tax=Drosophila miranda TaxID=7229 RepID=UPI0007E7A6A4|nr:uncharacterized protein LOC108154079 isoform X2 [Drosophila miranda]